METVSYGEGGNIMIDLRFLPRSDAWAEMSITEMENPGIVSETQGKIRSSVSGEMPTADLWYGLEAQKSC